MAQWAKCSPQKRDELSLNSQNPCGADAVTAICNPSTPLGRQDGSASLIYASANERHFLKVRKKSKADTQGCTLTSTPVSFTCEYTHIIHKRLKQIYVDTRDLVEGRMRGERVWDPHHVFYRVIVLCSTNEVEWSPSPYP